MPTDAREKKYIRDLAVAAKPRLFQCRQCGTHLGVLGSAWRALFGCQKTWWDLYGSNHTPCEQWHLNQRDRLKDAP